MSLAASRSRRANAGANMSKLLDQEEDAADDFYKTHYGGFDEIENDSDFEDSNSSDSENVIDSDFDIDETQAVPEVDADTQEKKLEAEERETRRKRNIYKDPKAKKQVGRKPKAQQSTTPVKSTPSTSTATPGRPGRKRQISESSKAAIKHVMEMDEALGGGSVSKNLRRSTQKSSQETRDMIDERKRVKKKKRKINKDEYRELTQAELLREAKHTEVENLKSLELYKNMEIEKVKKIKPKVQAPNVPMVKYHSYTEFEYDGDEDDLEDDEQTEDSNDTNTKKNKNPKKYSRTVITFPSDESLRTYFPWYKPPEPDSLDSILVNGNSTKKDPKPDPSTEKPEIEPVVESATISALSEPSSSSSSPSSPPGRKLRERRICPVTKEPAKYFDPLTQMPYANLAAFRFIRRQYVNYLQSFDHLRDDPRVKKFVEQNPQEKVQAITQFNVPVKKKLILKAAPPGLTTLGAAGANSRMGVRLATYRPVIITPGTNFLSTPAATPTTLLTLPASVGPAGVPLGSNLTGPIAISAITGNNVIGTTTTSNTPLMAFPTFTLPTGATLAHAPGTMIGPAGVAGGGGQKMYYITQASASSLPSNAIIIQQPAGATGHGQQIQLIPSSLHHQLQPKPPQQH